MHKYHLRVTNFYGICQEKVKKEKEEKNETIIKLYLFELGDEVLICVVPLI